MITANSLPARPTGPCTHVNKPLPEEAQRLNLGLTYRDLGRRTGIPHHRLHKILTGRLLPRHSELITLRQHLNTTHPEFLRSIQQEAVPFLQSRLP